MLLLLLISMSYKYSVGLCVRSFTDAVRSLQSMRKCFSYLGKLIRTSRCQVFLPHFSYKSLPDLSRKFTVALYFFFYKDIFLQFNMGIAGGLG